MVAILIAALVYGMPVQMAGWAFVHGAGFGLLPIGWTIFTAMLLYNITVETGQFTIIRRSIAGSVGDARVQAVLIGFCFGAFLEGAAGAGSPVAICGAILVGLGVPPLPRRGALPDRQHVAGLLRRPRHADPHARRRPRHPGRQRSASCAATNCRSCRASSRSTW